MASSVSAWTGRSFGHIGRPSFGPSPWNYATLCVWCMARLRGLKEREQPRLHAVPSSTAVCQETGYMTGIQTVTWLGRRSLGKTDGAARPQSSMVSPGPCSPCHAHVSAGVRCSIVEPHTLQSTSIHFNRPQSSQSSARSLNPNGKSSLTENSPSYLAPRSYPLQSPAGYESSGAKGERRHRQEKGLRKRGGTSSV